MQQLLSYIRRGVQQYNLIKEGDKIAVGLSGGKDSTLLIMALQRLRRFLGVKFDILGITLDMQMTGEPTDFSPLEALMKEEEIEYHIIRSDIGKIVFSQRQESNPCSLCARMRRGLLHDTAKELGCNKIALGHHQDDALETFFMNLFNEGRIGCFSPKSYLSRKDITMIRPMALVEERYLIGLKKRLQIPIVESGCTVDGHTERENMKQYIKGLEKWRPGVKKQIFGAMQRKDLDGWGIALAFKGRVRKKEE